MCPSFTCVISDIGHLPTISISIIINSNSSNNNRPHHIDNFSKLKSFHSTYLGYETEAAHIPQNHTTKLPAHGQTAALNSFKFKMASNENPP